MVGFFTPLCLGPQRRGQMVTEGHPPEILRGKPHPDSNQLYFSMQDEALGEQLGYSVYIFVLKYLALEQLIIGLKELK